MTCSPRPRLFSRLAPVALAAVIAGLATTGCEDKHIGRICDLGVTDDGGTTVGSNATINSQAVECPSRICLYPASDKITNTTSLCTADCSSNDDCGGEITGNPADKHCKTGFVCMRPTTVGDFCCRPMCVCKDFVDLPITTPAACMPGQSTCKNVH